MLYKVNVGKLADVCVFTLIDHEGFICLDQLKYQGTNQRCCVEDVSLLCEVRNIRPSFTIIRHRPRSALHLKPI